MSAGAGPPAVLGQKGYGDSRRAGRPRRSGGRAADVAACSGPESAETDWHGGRGGLAHVLQTRRAAPAAQYGRGGRVRRGRSRARQGRSFTKDIISWGSRSTAGKRSENWNGLFEFVVVFEMSGRDFDFGGGGQGRERTVGLFTSCPKP